MVVKGLDALVHAGYGFLTAHTTLLNPWLGLVMFTSYILYQYYDSKRGELWDEMKNDVLEFTVGLVARALLLALGY